MAHRLVGVLQVQSGDPQRTLGPRGGAELADLSSSAGEVRRGHDGLAGVGLGDPERLDGGRPQCAGFGQVNRMARTVAPFNNMRLLA